MRKVEKGMKLEKVRGVTPKEKKSGRISAAAFSGVHSLRLLSIGAKLRARTIFSATLRPKPIQTHFVLPIPTRQPVAWLSAPVLKTQTSLAATAI